MMMAPQAHGRPAWGPNAEGRAAVRRLLRGATRRHAREPERDAVNLNSTCPCLHALNFKFSIQTPKTVDMVFVEESMLYTIGTSRAPFDFELSKKT
jgi:hypothetical protein